LAVPRANVGRAADLKPFAVPGYYFPACHRLLAISAGPALIIKKGFRQKSKMYSISDC
jgi:hypothetical protein